MSDKPAIARGLKDELGWEPVLWISYSDQREQVAEYFPDACFQTIADAFYGRPIPGVNSPHPHVPEAALWERLQRQIPTMLAMMDYYGPPDVFLYTERVRFARELLLQWNEVISVLRPDIVFFEEAPHAPHTWALYALCLEYNIPTPFFAPTTATTFSVLKDRVDGSPLRVPELYREFREAPADREVHPEIRETAAGLCEGDTFSHWYMTRQETPTEVDEDPTERAVGRVEYLTKRLADVRGWPRYLRTLASIPAARRRAQDARERWLDQPSEGVLLKHPGRPLGDPPFSMRDYEAYKIASASRKAVLKFDYLVRCVEPDPDNDDFIYVAVHYQPERTTDSDGGVFRDQYLAIAMLHEALPEGWLLYVKEHPSQFVEMLHGDKGRTTAFYDDLERLERVRLIAPDYPSKRLAERCKAVATITGTVGWEAVLNGRPSIVFGYPWYAGCPGVHEVSSVEEVREALASIAGGGRVSEQDLTAYLQALSAGAFRVDLAGWLKDHPSVTLAEQVAGTVEAMEWWMTNRYSERSHD